MTGCEFCGSRVEELRVADDFTASGAPVYVTRFRCEDCGVVDGVAPARRAVRCEWPEGCEGVGEVSTGALLSCFDHFIETGSSWRISMIRADAAGVDWRAPLRARAAARSVTR